MKKTIVTTSDDNEEYSAYIADGFIYMDVDGLNEFFSPYDVRILQANQLGNDTNTPKALIYMEDEVVLESSPAYVDGELIVVFDVSEYELMEVKQVTLRKF